jgi:hypothetical protein
MADQRDVKPGLEMLEELRSSDFAAAVERE